MNTFFRHTTIVLLLVCGLAACGSSDHAAPVNHHGPHGGQLATTDGDTLELVLDGHDNGARFRVWLTRDGRPLAAPAATLVTMRLGGREETFALRAQADGSLIADTSVAEPHSFDVRVAAILRGVPKQWTLESREGRTRIPAAVARANGVAVAPVAAGRIRTTRVVQGLVTPVEGRTGNAAARFAGVVRALDAKVGDRVRAGQRLASIESNQSLSRYAVTAPLAGVITARPVVIGSVVDAGAVLFEITDSSELWADLHVFGHDAQAIAVGMPVTLTRLADGATATAYIDRILPGIATASQSTIARATVDNRDGQWRAGAAVRAEITLATRAAARVVPLAALQIVDGRDVVFRQVGEEYQAQPVVLGVRDGEQAEVVSGIDAGDLVVVAQSYLIKADIEKAGAEHVH